MHRIALLALSFVLFACASKPPPSSVTPVAPPESPPVATSPTPEPSPPEAPTAPTFNLEFGLDRASQLWIPQELTADEQSSRVVAKLRHAALRSAYLIQAVPVPSSMDTRALTEKVLMEAADVGIETSEMQVSADGMNASFFFEAYGSEVRGKTYILRKPNLPIALIVQAMWPLAAHEATLPDIDAMNASLDYTVTTAQE